jgi:hypothetical protein
MAASIAPAVDACRRTSLLLGYTSEEDFVAAPAGRLDRDPRLTVSAAPPLTDQVVAITRFGER